MANLTDEQKLEIVSMLACFREPASIVTYFQSEYGLQIDHKQVGRYDPTRSYFAGGEKWREIFEARRKTYLTNVEDVPVAHQAYRLNLLQEGVEAAKKAGDWVLVAKLSEQPAKEVGGALTNQHKVRVDAGRKSVRDMSPEDRKAALADVIAKAQMHIVEKSDSGVH